MSTVILPMLAVLSVLKRLKAFSLVLFCLHGLCSYAYSGDEELLRFLEEKPGLQNPSFQQLNSKSVDDFQAVLHRVAKTILPTTVNIITHRSRQGSTQDSIYPIDQSASGSGFIISPSGFILTNYHVIKQGIQIEVMLLDRECKNMIFPAELVGFDERTDLAILKIESGFVLPYATLGDSNQVQIGDMTIVIGNPFGLTGTMAFGIISYIGRDDIESDAAYKNYIQVDASINFGNSGGPLINMQGQVIGMNSMVYSTALSGTSVGIGFAIPINIIKKTAGQILKGGSVTRGYLGVVMHPLSPVWAKHFEVEPYHGVFIEQVEKQSPAFLAGLQERDIILSINQISINSPSQLQRVIADMNQNDTIHLMILRNKKKMQLDIQLSTTDSRMNRTVDATKHRQSVSKENAWGIMTKDLSDVWIKSNPNTIQAGAMVTQVEPESPAYRSGIRINDILVQIDVGGTLHPIQKAKDLTECIEKNPNRYTFLCKVFRQPIYLFLMLETMMPGITP